MEPLKPYNQPSQALQPHLQILLIDHHHALTPERVQTSKSLEWDSTSDEETAVCPMPHEDQQHPPTPGGGDGPEGSNNRAIDPNEQKFCEILKTIKGNQLEGNLPELFKGDQADTMHFLLAFD